MDLKIDVEELKFKDFNIIKFIYNKKKSHKKLKYIFKIYIKITKYIKYLLNI